MLEYSKNKKRKKSNEERLRLCVFRSNMHIYAQIIDDKEAKTLVASSSLKLEKTNDVKAAVEVGKQIAVEAKKKKIESVFFDRNSYPYKGKVKALADSARANGLKF